MSESISILLLEDSPLDADLVRQELLLGGLEHTARCVDTKEAFESALREKRPDLILSDFSLPGFNGMEALDFAATNFPDVPFIFVSGAIGEESAIESLKHGASDYVLKHRLRVLVPAVKRALQTAEERRERHRAQEALRRSEEHLRLAVKTAKLGTWDLDITTGEMNASALCRETFGLGPDTVLDYKTLRAATHPEDLPQLTERIQNALASGGAYEAEYRIFWPDGSIRWLAAQGVAVRNPNGIVTRLVGVTLDITARKQVEENLARQAEELTTLNADLRQFAYAASHDLQEPLRMVTIYTQLLAERYKDQLDEETRHHFSFIEAGTNRMAALLRDLLTYMQLQTTVRDFGSVDMNNAVQQVLTVLNMALEEAGAKVTWDPLPTVLGDESQIEQIFQNLIGNAIKYRRAEPLQIHISAVRQGPCWTFEVHDNGIGFEPEFGEQIFGLFKRLNPRDYPGTGLGLAICRRIVGNHGGRISAHSTLGQGSVFTFSLPADDMPKIDRTERVGAEASGD